MEVAHARARTAGTLILNGDDSNNVGLRRIQQPFRLLQWANSECRKMPVGESSVNLCAVREGCSATLDGESSHYMPLKEQLEKVASPNQEFVESGVALLECVGGR